MSNDDLGASGLSATDRMGAGVPSSVDTHSEMIEAPSPPMPRVQFNSVAEGRR